MVQSSVEVGRMEAMGNWLCGVHSKPLHAAHYFHNIGAQVLQHWLPHDSNGAFPSAPLLPDPFASRQVFLPHCSGHGSVHPTVCHRSRSAQDQTAKI